MSVLRILFLGVNISTNILGLRFFLGNLVSKLRGIFTVVKVNYA